MATEKRDLANQSAEATTEIQAENQRMQGSANKTTLQIQEIIRMINDVNHIVSTMAAAVAQQSAVTSEIPGNVF